MKKRIALWAALAVSLFLLAGCEKSPGGSGPDREKVTIALWSDQLTEQYGQYLQNSFPEVDFEFYVATNSADFYRFKEERGDLPDILTVRRFSLRDVANWKDSLMDLSACELVNAFPQTYLRSYTYSDGTVNWLPACAEVDGIIMNKTLFKEKGVAVPTNYQEFVSACSALRAKGVRPFASNFGADFTCMEVLQGLSIGQLTSQAGREWRQQYESGQTDQLSEEVWLPVFQRMEEFIRYAGITGDDLVDDTAGIFDAYRAGEAAMIRGTSNEAKYYNVGEGSALMPYFGDTENWYLTYPSFQVAASVRAEESPERKELILRILEAMLNQDGFQRVAAGGDMIAYNKGVDLVLSPLLSQMPPCLERNLLYIRLASSDMFALSKETVQGMITGKYPDAHSAFNAFSAAIGASGSEKSAAAHVNDSYSYAFNPQGGSQAASAVMNTVREETGAELLIGPCSSVAGNIAAGDYTESELRFLTMGESPSTLLCEMTGEQLYQYVDYVLTTPGKRGSVINDSTLYVSSGFEMEVKKTDGSYVLERLTIDGVELDRAETYRVAVIGDMYIMLEEALKAAGVASYTSLDTAYKQIVVERLISGGQLAAPTPYIILH